MPQPSPARGLRFGCRLFACLPARPAHAPGAADAFIKACLLDSDNSLRRQTQLRGERTSPRSWESLIFNGKNTEGSGIVAFRPDANPFVYKSATPTPDDPRYPGAVRQAVAKPLSALLAHVRAGPNPHESNNHPFVDRHGRWAFMHNGFISRPVQDALQARVERDDLPLIKERVTGTTDSELMFYRLLGHMHRAHGTTDPARITSEQLLRLVRRTIRELIQESSARDRQARHQPLRGGMIDDLAAAGIRSEAANARVSVLPALNLVLSDGQRIVASCYQHTLWLSAYELPTGERGAFFSSEPIPLDAPGQGRLLLQQEIPEGHVALLERAGDGDDGLRLTLRALNE